jgi:hypothetical protein
MTNAPQEITVEEIVQRLRDYLIGRVSQDEHEDDLDLAIDALEDAARRAVSQGETTIIPGSDYSKLYAAYYALIAERDKLKEEVQFIKSQREGFIDRNTELRERVSELERALQWISDNDVEADSEYQPHGVIPRQFALKARAALEKIKFRNHPGTTNHELAKEALSRTSEET